MEFGDKNLKILFMFCFISTQICLNIAQFSRNQCGIVVQNVPSLRNLNEVAACLQEFARYGKIQKPLDYGLHTPQILQRNGYLVQTYSNVTSRDGYIQTIFRVTGSRKSPPREGKPAVLLMHGLVSSSENWFLIGNKSFPFLLADAGYEVWLANNRGSTYSQKHVTLDPNQDFKYWDFSFHEVAVYDVPLYVDLMLKETKSSKVFLFGHSIGATILVATLAEHPELNSKIHAVFPQGPFVVPHEMLRVHRLLSLSANIPPGFMDYLLNNVILGRLDLSGLNQRISQFCSATSFTCGVCSSSFEPGKVDNIQFLGTMTRGVNVASLKMGLHVLQNLRMCRFAKYNYGPNKNLRLYNQTFPPDYQLKNVKAPMFIYYGNKDMYTTVKDQAYFVNQLPPGTVRAFRRIADPDFGHLDSVLHKNADKLVYIPILNDMNEVLRSSS